MQTSRPRRAPGSMNPRPSLEPAMHPVPRSCEAHWTPVRPSAALRPRRAWLCVCGRSAQPDTTLASSVSRSPCRGKCHPYIVSFLCTAYHLRHR
eukprot:7062495-Lingulodinium_polyedra.AAC.1